MTVPVHSLMKAFAVLQAVAAGDRPASVAEVAARCGLPRPTVYRLVASLVAGGYLLEMDGRYSIGFEFLPLAAALLDKNPLRLEALPHLQELSRKVGERTNLGILHRGKVMILGGFERPSLPTIYSRFGRVIPAHCSGLGKALLAQLPPQEVVTIVGKEPFERRTANTITDMATLLSELEAVRQRGYATEAGENTETSRCIAAPIIGADSRPIGAVSISVASRVHDDLEKLATELLRTTELISHFAWGHRAVTSPISSAGRRVRTGRTSVRQKEGAR